MLFNFNKKTPKKTPEPFDFFCNNFTFIHLIIALKVILSHSMRHFLLQDTIFYQIIRSFPSVPIFFITSGFLISASFRRSQSYGSYLKNRIVRIYPALYASLCMSLVMMFCLYNPDLDATKFILWLFAQLTLCQYYNPDFFRGYGTGVMNGSLWSISVQMQFYLILPFILYCTKKYYNLILWGGIFIGLMLINYTFYSFFTNSQTKDILIIKLIHISVFPHLFLFLIGIFFQYNQHLIQRYLKDNFLFFACLYAIFSMVSYHLGLRYQGAEFNPVLGVCLGLAVLSFAYSYTNIFANIAKGYDISYGLYVYHQPIINMLLALNFFSAWINMGLTVMITGIISLLSLKYIEKPAVKFIK